MARRRRTGATACEQASPDPGSLAAYVPRYLAWLGVRGYAEATIVGARLALRHFLAFCEERGLSQPSELTRLVIELYQRQVAGRRRKDGAPVAQETQFRYLWAVRGLCRWLTRQRLLLYNPAAELELPRRPKKLPRTILTAEEVERILAIPDIATPLGLRDRAILETFYSTGIRRSELAMLAIFDLDFTRGVLTVREGKGRKDRVVPIGERALTWIAKYLDEARPSLVVEPDDGTLFLTVEGERFRPNRLTELVAELLRTIGKPGSCHLFRHTAATLMLEHGADIRFIQQMLGHEHLSTTEIYTHVSIRALKEVHDATHPGARLRHEPRGEQAPAGQEETGQEPDGASERERLFAALAAEDEEEDQDTERSAP